jgi:N utilization substance protein B
MKTKNDPRHQSRIIALQKLFEQEFKSNSPFPIAELQLLNEDRVEPLQIDETFALSLVKGVMDNETEIDNIIRKYTMKRPFEDTSKIDLLVLRIAIFELLYASKKLPEKVIIDEAVELGKEFGGNKSFTFINGILGNISHDYVHEKS